MQWLPPASQARGRHARMSGRNGLDGRGEPAGNRRRLPAVGQRPRPDHRSCVGTGHRPAARRNSAAGYTPKRIDPCTKIPKGPAAGRSGGPSRRGRPSRRRILPHRLYDLRRQPVEVVADARPDSPTHDRRGGRRLRHGSTIRRLDRRQRALPHLGGRSEKTTVTTRARLRRKGAAGFDAARGLGPRRHRPRRASPQTPPRKYDSSRSLRRNSAALRMT